MTMPSTTSNISSGELRVLATKSSLLLIDEVGPIFERKTGLRLVLTTDLPVETKRKIAAGIEFDVAILSPVLVDQLIEEGVLDKGTRADIVRVGIGAAVRSGAKRPDITTVDKFKQALLDARSIAYLKEGNTGLYLARLVDQMGISEQLRGKTILPVRDVVADLVASGEAELGLTAISLLLAHPGLDVVGPIPSEMQFYIAFTGGVGTSARHAAAGWKILQMLTSPEMVRSIKAKGMEPG
jgi:molybdate transport system substrate-binding protein